MRRRWCSATVIRKGIVIKLHKKKKRERERKAVKESSVFCSCFFERYLGPRCEDPSYSLLRFSWSFFSLFSFHSASSCVLSFFLPFVYPLFRRGWQLLKLTVWFLTLKQKSQSSVQSVSQPNLVIQAPKPSATDY